MNGLYSCDFIDGTGSSGTNDIKKGEKKIVIIEMDTNGEITITDIARFDECEEIADIAKEIIVGFTKYFKKIYSYDRFIYLKSVLRHYLNLLHI